MDFQSELTLSNCLAYATENNPGLQAAESLRQAAQSEAAGADRLPNPTFNYAYFLEEVQTRVGPQEQKFGLRQKVPWYGTRGARQDVAGQNTRIRSADVELNRRALRFDVKRAFFEYAYLHQAIEIARDNIDLLTHLEEVARSLYKTGGPQTDVIKAQVELGKLEDRLLTLEEQRGPVRAQLNAAMNRPHDAALSDPPSLPDFAAPADHARLFDRLQNHPALERLTYVADRARKQTELARKSGLPDVVLGVDYIDTGDALSANTPGSGDDPLIAMVALELPIWRGAVRSDVATGQWQERAATLEREQQENRLATELKTALFRYEDANRKVGLYRDTLVPQADQALQVTEEAYRVGNGDFLDLIDAERLLLEFQLAAQRALADRAVAWAEIEKLVGTEGQEEEQTVRRGVRK